jgi:hypothetical protein
VLERFGRRDRAERPHLEGQAGAGAVQGVTRHRLVLRTLVERHVWCGLAVVVTAPANAERACPEARLVH